MATMLIEDVAVGDSIGDADLPRCCGRDMELNIRSDSNEWECGCGTFIETIDGMVTELDR